MIPEYVKVQNPYSRLVHIAEWQGLRETTHNYTPGIIIFPLCYVGGPQIIHRGYSDFDPDHDLEINLCVRCRQRWEDTQVERLIEGLEAL